MESVPENVIKQHGTGQSDIDRASKRAEEEVARRYEAAAWLRRTIGVVGAKDLPEEPSEEEFRIGLRNGIILCNALNKVQPGAIPKVVAAPADLCVIPDGAPLSAYQYFENVRNFLVTLQGMGLPTFQASDLERGGKDSSVVDSVLALKFYIESKDGGKNSSSKFGGITRHASSVKHFIRKSSDPFMNSISRAQSLPEKPPDLLSLENTLSGDFLIHSTEVKSFNSLNTLVRTALSNKKTEEIPLIVETMLNKVMQEYERRIAYQKEMAKSTSQDMVDDNKSTSSTEHFPIDAEKMMEVHENVCKIFAKESKVKGNAEIELEGVKEKENIAMISKQQANEIKDKALKERFVKQQLIFDRQQKEIQKLKCSLQFTKTGVEHMKSHYLEEFDNLRNRICLLATAASGYQKVLEENRKLYNQVQDLKGNIRVYCRVRPFLPGQMSSISILDGMDDQNITISSPLKTGKDARRSFTFNKVYGPSVSQEEVFSDTQPLIRSVLDGYNICIFAYGQTGSGKTHTMSGPKELNERTIGVNYRALNNLFYLSDLRKDTFWYDISVQMIEIYNEQVRDLLNDGLHRRLDIRNSSNKGVSVPDANLIPVRSTEEVIDVMNLGQKNRAVSCTAMNDRSSRSHSCLTIHVHGKELASGNAIRGCMHLVDLAGSERVDKSEVKGERLKEAQHINKSLSALGDVIAALAQKNSHVPYRNSKLTQLLQDSLGGRAKTLMFVHISPEANALGETLSTLKFAERVATVELGHAKINKDSGEVKELKEQIAALKIELSKKEGGEPLRPTTSSSDSSRIKQNPFSTTYANDEEDELRYRTNNRQPMEEVGDIEVRNNSTKQNNSNYHAEESPVSMESPWPDSSPQPDKDDREISSGEWVDKVVVNNKSITHVGEDEVQEQELLLRYLNEMRVFTEHEVNGNAAAKERMNNFDSDSYDFENSASDSSEIECLNHLNVLSIPSKSKLKKPQAMGIKGMDGRNSIHGHVPTPSRKVLNGSTQTSNRTPRKPVSADGKRSGIQSGGK